MAIHCKSTFFAVYTNSRSFIVTEYKCRLISTLLYKGLTIVSDYQKLPEEIVKLNSFVKQRG